MSRKTISLCLGLLFLLALLPGRAAAAENLYTSGPLSGRLVLVENLDLADFSFYFTAKDNALGNKGAIGALNISCTLNGPSSVKGLLISSWWDEMPSDEEIDEEITQMVEIWKEAEVYIGSPTSTSRESSSRPVYPDDVGIRQYTLLIGLKEKYEVGGYAIVEIDLDIGQPSPEHILSTATQYVPYKAAISATQEGSSFSLSSGSLPEGLSLSASGVLSGIPVELGVFGFTVTEVFAGGNVEHKCTLSVFSRMYADVEENNVPGYGFVEAAGDDGRVHDQVVTSASELTDQVMHLQGAYSEFRNLYLDARKLIRDVEYYAEEGSTKITLLGETIGGEGGGTHTLAAEFEMDDGEMVYTVQNYTVAGIASREVHVTVFGETVIWTDAEPYIDTNNRTMTPFRVVGDVLGLTIDWDSVTREASFSDGTKTIWFPIGSTTARTSEGQTVEMDTSAVIVNGRTYAPIRYLAQYFGYSVSWDSTTRTVIIQ